MADRSPAQIFALVIGAVLVLAGILGFFYSAAFGTPGKTEAVLGILAVNGWHNVVHIASGALGLLAAPKPAAARTYAIGLAIVYTVVTIWGFALGDGGAILDIVPVNTEDNVLHLLIALAGFGAFAASSPRETAGPRREAAV